MTEMEKANKLPVNLEALRWLKEAGQKPDHSILHSTQLMEWALDSGEYEPRDDLRWPIMDSLETLKGADPQKAMDYLTLTDSGDVGISRKELSQAETPEEAAAMLIECLHSKLQATVSGYPRPPQVPLSL